MPWRRHQRGQGILELIITFAIVGIGLGASLTLLLSSGIQNRRTELDAVAENLAREGIEYFRSVRDSNWLAGNAFDTGFFLSGDYNGIVAFNPDTGGWSHNFSATTATHVSGTTFTISYPQPHTIVYDVNGMFEQAQGGLGAVVGAQETRFWRIFYNRSICRRNTGAESVIPQPDCSSIVNATKIGVSTTVRVQWTDRDKTFESILEEQFYNWRPTL